MLKVFWWTICFVTQERNLFSDSALSIMQEIYHLTLTKYISASRWATEVQKKGKSSEFNPKNYEHVKSSPSLKVWSHESVKHTVKFDKWVNLRGAKKYQKKFLRSDGRWFGDPKDTIDTKQLKNHVYLLRFGHTSALLLKKKKVTRKGHFPRPAETDPYVGLWLTTKFNNQR